MEIRSEKRTEGTDQSAGCVASGEEETFSESPLFLFFLRSDLYILLFLLLRLLGERQH